MHKATERPERDECPSGQDVELVGDRRLEDERRIRMQVEDGTEPGRDCEPVVVRVPGERADQGGAEAEQDRGHEQHIHGLVVASCRHEHRTDSSAAVDQDDRAGHCRQASDGAESERDSVIGRLTDPDRLRPRLGNEQAANVTESDQENAEVEEGAADSQQPALVKLGRAGGPAKFVIPVAPDMTDDEGRESRIRYPDPQEDVQCTACVGAACRDGHRSTTCESGMYSGGANAASPTRSSGGPSAARRAAAARWSPRSGGSVAEIESSTSAHGESHPRSASRSSSSPARCAVSIFAPLSGTAVAAYSSITAR